MPILCRKKCAGCIEGSMCYKICSIAPCSIEHGDVNYCFECREYPCSKYDGIEDHDSLITHINQKIDMEKAKTMGVEEYNNEQSHKVRILHKLLENYNPGNDKELFFCTAINLLPLDGLIKISDNLDEDTEDMTLDEKYVYVKEKLLGYAKNMNIKIELREGKYNKEKITFN